MYKCFVVVVMVICCLILSAGISKADVINLNLTKWNLPEAQAGAIISFKEEGIEATLTTKVLAKEFEWGIISLNAGAAPAINEPILSLTYRLPPNAMEKWGLDIPYADLFDLQAGFYVGFEMNAYANDPNDKWLDALDYGAALVSFSIRI